MATYGWEKESSVEDGLFAVGHEFDFYQAVRLLEFIFPEKAPIGEGLAPGKETVCFRAKTGLDFPASEVASIARPPVEGEPAEMVENFMSLFGALGAMPHPYSELLLERLQRKDTAFRDFVDIFQIGARNMQNYPLITKVAKSKKPILLKRHFGASIRDLLGAAEYALIEKNEKVILCERGITAPHTHRATSRFLLDIQAIPAIKDNSCLPIISDPSHACFWHEWVKPLSLASLAAGAEGTTELPSTPAEPVPYERSEFPDWAHVLRRAEVTAIGSLPFTLFGVRVLYDYARYAAHGFSADVRPFPFRPIGGGTALSDTEMFGIVIGAAALSITIAVIDAKVRGGRREGDPDP